MIASSTTPPYTNWTSVYIANARSPPTCCLYPNDPTSNPSTPPPSPHQQPVLNFFLGGINNNGIADQYFTNPIRFASIGHSLSPTEVTEYYQIVQSLQEALGRAI
jgi:hypothetical protein